MRKLFANLEFSEVLTQEEWDRLKDVVAETFESAELIVRDGNDLLIVGEHDLYPFEFIMGNAPQTSVRVRGVVLKESVPEEFPDVLAKRVNDFLQTTATDYAFKATTIDISDGEKRIVVRKAKNGSNLETESFVKKMSASDYSSLYEEKSKEFGNEIADLVEKEGAKALESLLGNALTMYNYSFSNILLASMYAQSQGIEISKLASMSRWNKIKAKVSADIEGTERGVVYKITINPDGGDGKRTVRVKAVVDEVSKGIEVAECNENWKPKWDMLTLDGEIVSISDVSLAKRDLLRKNPEALEDKNVEDIKKAAALLQVVSAFKKDGKGIESGETKHVEKEIGVTVLKGSKSLPIFVPIRKKVKIEEQVYETDEEGNLVTDENGMPVPVLDEEGNPLTNVVEEERIVGYKIGRVFDYSQTTAKYLGIVGPTRKMSDLFSSPSRTDEEYDRESELVVAIADAASDVVSELAGSKVSIRPIIAKGYNVPNGTASFDKEGRPVEIRINLDSIETPREFLSVLFHEIGHILMHGNDERKDEKALARAELEAESFSILATKAFGLEPQKANAAYISKYSQVLGKLPSVRRNVIKNIVKKVTPMVKTFIDEILEHPEVVKVVNGNDSAPEDAQKNRRTAKAGMAV